MATSPGVRARLGGAVLHGRRRCGDGGGGSLVVGESTLDVGGVRTLAFCVEGDTLWLHDSRAAYPDLGVIRLERSTGDAGAR